MNLDIGNFRPPDVYDQIEMSIPYAVSTHIKTDGGARRRQDARRRSTWTACSRCSRRTASAATWASSTRRRRTRRRRCRATCAAEGTSGEVFRVNTESVHVFDRPSCCRRLCHGGDRLRLSKSSPANRPWPPGVQKVSNESPVLPPADALKTFYMPPGYHLELVASEPLDSGPDGHRLGSRRAPVGRRDDRLRARSAGAGAEPGSDRQRRGARGHEPRRRGWTSGRCLRTG